MRSWFRPNPLTSFERPPAVPEIRHDKAPLLWASVQMEDYKKCWFLPRTSMMNCWAPAFWATKKRPNVFNNRFNKPDGTSLHRVTDKTHVVTPAVLETGSTYRPARPYQVSMSSNLRHRTKHTLLIRFRTGTSELLSNDLRLEAFEASCGRATRDDWNTVSDPGAGSSEVNAWPPMARLASPPFRTTHKNQYRQSPRNSEQKRSRSTSWWLPHHEERVCDQHTSSYQQLQEGAENVWQTRMAESTRPAATPPEGPRSSHRPFFLPHHLEHGPCQLYHAQHHPLLEHGLCSWRQHRRRLHLQHTTTRVHGVVVRQHWERERMVVLTENSRAKQPQARVKLKQVGKQYDSEMRHLWLVTAVHTQALQVVHQSRKWETKVHDWPQDSGDDVPSESRRVQVDECPDIIITWVIHHLFQLTTFRGWSQCPVTSHKPATLPNSSTTNLESPQNSPNTSRQTGRAKILPKKRSGSPGTTRRSEISQFWVAVIQDTTDSEVCLFNTEVTKDHRESKRPEHACTQATEKRKLAVQISNLRFRTSHDGASRLVSDLLPVECLSILRQVENGLLDQEKSQSRKNTCCGRQRDTHASWTAKQNTLSRQKLDNRADHRTFPFATQPHTNTHAHTTHIQDTHNTNTHNTQHTTHTTQHDNFFYMCNDFDFSLLLHLENAHFVFFCILKLLSFVFECCCILKPFILHFGCTLKLLIFHWGCISKLLIFHFCCISKLIMFQRSARTRRKRPQQETTEKTIREDRPTTRDTNTHTAHTTLTAQTQTHTNTHAHGTQHNTHHHFPLSVRVCLCLCCHSPILLNEKEMTWNRFKNMFDELEVNTKNQNKYEQK